MDDKNIELYEGNVFRKNTYFLHLIYLFNNIYDI